MLQSRGRQISVCSGPARVTYEFHSSREYRRRTGERYKNVSALVGSLRNVRKGVKKVCWAGERA